MEHGYSQPKDPPKDAYYNPSYPYMVKQETYGPPPSATGKPNYGPPSPHPQYPQKPKQFQTRLKRDNNGFQSFSGQYFGSMSYDSETRNQDEKLTEIVRQIMLEVIEKNQSLDEVNATIKHPEASDLQLHLPLSKPSLNSKREYNAESAFPPVISTHDLPAPYGCRSIATKKCYKVPMVVPKKVPYEKCKNIPSVDCAIVLKKVPELECVPKVFEECMDVAQETPYLAPDEECEELIYEECVEVKSKSLIKYSIKILFQIEEKIPVELCKRKKLDEESIFLTRGPVFRKEGPKRRNGPVRG